MIEQVQQHARLIIADDYELAIQRTESVLTSFHNGKLTLQNESQADWISLRIEHRKRPGRSVVCNKSVDLVNALVEGAFQSAKLTHPDPWFRFPLWKNIPLETKETVEELSPFSSSVTSEKRVNVDVIEERYETANVQTILVRKCQKTPRRVQKRIFGLKFSVLTHVGSNYYWLHDERASQKPLEKKGEWLEKLLQDSETLKEGILFNDLNMAKKGPVIFGPRVNIAFLKKISDWFYADKVQAGRVPLCGKTNETLFSSKVTLIDDGTLEHARNSSPFDMEGSLSQKTTLVNQGVLTSLLYDTYSGARDNRLSTGNFVRSGSTLEPAIGATNLYLAPDQNEINTLIRQLDQGIVIDGLHYLESVPDTETEFFLKASGWEVHGGQVIQPLLDIRLKLDVFDLFKNVAMIGNDLTFHGSFGAPSILFENVPLR